MKKTFLAIASAAIVSISALFSGCSGFAMSETKEIDEISAKTLTDGSTQITITYVDNLYDPVVFTIPKGQQGVAGPTGNGIATFEEVVDPVTGELVPGTNSCMMCKRMIINAGISTLVVRDTEEDYRVIDVQSWIDDDDSLSGVFGY